MRLSVWHALGLAHAAAATCTPSGSPLPTATLDSGPVFGTPTLLPNAAFEVNKFLGVPFAAPPVRFAAATKPERWTTPLNASVFGPACIQNYGISPLGPKPEMLQEVFNNPPAPESEDCLTINIFAPSEPGPKGGYPVLVFIPGGGWQLGSGRSDLSAFAAYENIVAVTFNYRTNIFGFPSAPEIPVQERNLGLYDQRLALDWVQRNAAAFGGNADKVTIWGESAGSLAVDLHLHGYAETDEPPFRAAILSSGQMSFGFLAFAVAGDAAWAAVATIVGCPADTENVECLRQVPAEQLKAAMLEAGTSFTPQRDNVTLFTQQAQRWREGRVAQVPILTGTVAEEGRALVNEDINGTLFLEVSFPSALVPAELVELILSVYRQDPRLSTDFDVYSAIYTDYFWQCPQYLLANASTAVGLPSWLYHFNTSTASFLPEEYQWLGKYHGSDLVLLFSDPSTAPYTPQSYAVYEAFRGAIGRFVHNPAGGPGWPAVGSSYAPWDIAVIGNIGNAPGGGATPANVSVVNERCSLYWQLYPYLELIT